MDPLTRLQAAIDQARPIITRLVAFLGTRP